VLHDYDVEGVFTETAEDADYAAEHGRLDVVKFLIEVRKQPFSAEATD
jgi:hypothetical protein